METKIETREHPNKEQEQTKRSVCLIEAQKRYYEKVKDTEHYKQIRRDIAKRHYENNKDKIKQNQKEKYKLKKDEK